MRKYSKKTYIIAGAAAAAIAVGGGAAYAFWSNSGSGDGSATTDHANQFTVVVDNLVNHDLSPNGPTDHVTFTVHNNDSGAESISGAVATVSGTSAGAGCTAADFAITNTTVTTGTIASGATVSGSFDLQMIDTGVNQDPCQTATVNLHVAVS